MNTSFTYSNEYDPAMPIVELELGVTRAEVKSKVKALVDSGADGTMIRRRFKLRKDCLTLMKKKLYEQFGVRGWGFGVRGSGSCK